jgi:hypothetical protein
MNVLLPRSGVARQRGFSSIEVAIGLVVLTIGVTSLATGMASTTAGEVRVERRAAAMEGVIAKASEIRGLAIADLLAVYGAGGPQGVPFSIPSIDPGGALAGSIRIIADETLTDAQIGLALGFPRDLDGDGAAATTAAAVVALALPVVIEARFGDPRALETYRVAVICR